MLGTLRKQQLAIAKQLGRVARQSGACGLMMTMPGVGPLIAVSVLTTIEDFSWFRRSQDVGTYLSLILAATSQARSTSTAAFSSVDIVSPASCCSKRSISCCRGPRARWR